MRDRDRARDYLDRAWAMSPQQRLDDLVSVLRQAREQGASELLSQVQRLYETTPPAEFAKALSMLRAK